MKMPVTAFVGWVLIIAAFGFYLYGVADAIYLTLEGKAETYNGVLSSSTSSIQALMLTNLGALLGISVTNPIRR
jgi:hypothetical protein